MINKDRILEQISSIQSELEMLKFEVMNMGEADVESAIPEIINNIDDEVLKDTIEIFVMYLVANEKI
jgi:hypothetical protein